MSGSLDRIVDRIDAGDLRPRSHGVVRALAAHLQLSPLGTEVLQAFEKERSVGNSELLNRLWSEIEQLPLERQGGRRMLVSLLHPDAEIDGYQAGHLLSWSKDEGIPNETVLAAFEPD